VDQTSRKPDRLQGRWGRGLKGFFSAKMAQPAIERRLLVVCPEHINTLTVDGPYSRTAARPHSAGHRAPLSEMVAGRSFGCGIPPWRMPNAWGRRNLAQACPKFAARQYISYRRGGGDAGKFSSAFPRVGPRADGVDFPFPERIDLG